MRRKPELTALVRALWQKVPSVRIIAELLGVGERHIRKIVAREGLRPRYKLTLPAAVLAIGNELAVRAAKFRNGPDCRARKRESA